MPALLSILWLRVLLAAPPCVDDCELHCDDCPLECIETCEERCRGRDCTMRCASTCAQACDGCPRFCRRHLACGRRQACVSPVARRAAASTMRP